MIIGIDGNEANVEKRVGVSEYAFELLKQFKRYQVSGINSDQIGVKYQIYLKQEPLVSMPKEREGWVYRTVRPSKLWTQIGLPLDLYYHLPRPDVFFTPTHYAPRFSPVPRVVSVMDLSYIHFPQLFKQSDLYQLRNWTAYSVRKAAKVFTISRASKDDIIRIYKVPEDKVVVTYPGVKSQASNLRRQISNMNKLREKYGIKGDYILFVGTLQPRKNIQRLIGAFKKISNKESLQLVIVGKKGWLYEDILKAPKELDIEDRVKFLEFVDENELNSLYKHAICFVLPSLYEGFGLPVLEAMQNGCPVITSNVSSLPEAGGDAALYIDPLNIEDIASKIELLLKDEKLRKDLIAKGYDHVKKFSWEKTAQKTLEVLEEVVNKKA